MEETCEDIQICRDAKEVCVTWWKADKTTPDCYAFNRATLEGMQPILDRLTELFGIEVIVKYHKKK